MHFSPSVTEVARNFASFVNRVSLRGERFVLLRGNRPVAELGPVPAGRRAGDLPGLLASLPRLSREDATDLAVDLDRARAERGGTPQRDPWAS